MKLRKYRPEDCSEIAELFYHTVHTVNAADYTKEQLNAWADGKVDLHSWNCSFLAHETVVAEENGILVGFGDIDRSGYLDRLYVHKDCQGRGIATAIVDDLEERCQAEMIVTHASVMAKPFFEQRGYEVRKRQQVSRGGILLTNFVMEKVLI